MPRPGTLAAAAAGLAAATAVACLVYMGPATQAAAPAELLVRRLRSRRSTAAGDGVRCSAPIQDLAPAAREKPTIRTWSVAVQRVLIQWRWGTAFRTARSAHLAAAPDLL